MIKEALQYIVGLQQPKIIESGARRYTDANLRLMDEELRAEHIEMSTLSGLVDYIKAGVDDMSERMLVQVVSPTEVRLISQLDFDRKRECLVKVKAEIPEFSYGRFISTEAFLIGIRSKFIQNEGAEAILRFAGTVENGTVASYGDDGISQTATVKKRCCQQRNRTCTESCKTSSIPYIYRSNSAGIRICISHERQWGGDVTCAIFEADGGAWKREAMKNIKQHLEVELAELQQFTVIS